MSYGSDSLVQEPFYIITKNQFLNWNPLSLFEFKYIIFKILIGLLTCSNPQKNFQLSFLNPYFIVYTELSPKEPPQQPAGLACHTMTSLQYQDNSPFVQQYSSMKFLTLLLLHNISVHLILHMYFTNGEPERTFCPKLE